jgi:hypothetical protein
MCRQSARQGEVAGQLEAAPDRRPRAIQVQTHPEPADLARDREQRRRLGAPQSVEEAGHLPAHQRLQQRLVLLRAGTGQQLLHQVLDVRRFGHEGQSTPLDSAFAQARRRRHPLTIRVATMTQAAPPTTSRTKWFAVATTTRACRAG